MLGVRRASCTDFPPSRRGADGPLRASAKRAVFQLNEDHVRFGVADVLRVMFLRVKPDRAARRHVNLALGSARE